MLHATCAKMYNSVLQRHHQADLACFYLLSRRRECCLLTQIHICITYGSVCLFICSLDVSLISAIFKGKNQCTAMQRCLKLSTVTK